MNKTHQSIKNVLAKIISLLLTVVLSFVSRALFIKHLGAELVGLSSTMGFVMSLFNLAELGVYSAIAYFLYQPLHDNNKEAVREILATHRLIYRKIGVAVLILGVILTPFLPWWIHSPTMVWYYPILTFWAFMGTSLSMYFFNYRMIIFYANQESYKTTIIMDGIAKSKVVLQILSVVFIEHQPYLYWLALEVVAQIFQVVCIEWLLKRDYAWLYQSIVKPAVEIKNKIFVKVRHIFYYQIAKAIVPSVSPLFVYSYLNLSMVTIYTNYLMIVNILILWTEAVSSGVMSSIGHLVVEDNKHKETHILYELASIKLLMAGLFGCGFYFNASEFISAMFGAHFVLPSLDVLLFSFLISLTMLKDVPELFLFTRGIYDDKGAPIAEMVVLVIGALLLGKTYGVPGIIIASLLSHSVIFFWKPWYLEHKTQVIRFVPYLTHIVTYMLLIGLVGVGYAYIRMHFVTIFEGSLISSLLQIVVDGLIISSILMVLLAVMNPYFRLFLGRLWRVVRGR